MVCMMTVSDALATYVTAYHPSLASSICPNPSYTLLPPFLSPTPSNPLLTPSPLLAVGAIAAICGNLLRQRCFRELGPLFTFEVTIQPDHRLITSGPYNFVRHPSYSGVYLTLLGPTLMALSKGSWIRECWLTLGCGASSTSSSSWWSYVPSLGQFVMFSLLAFWTVKVLFALRSTNRRLLVEDRELHGVFGETWEEYERRGTWKLVPWGY